VFVVLVGFVVLLVFHPWFYGGKVSRISSERISSGNKQVGGLQQVTGPKVVRTPGSAKSLKGVDRGQAGPHAPNESNVP